MSEVCSAGFSTQVQPVASAGASFQVAMARGKFQGTIWPTTPIGWRRVKAWYSSPGIPMETSSVLPSTLVAQPAM